MKRQLKSLFWAGFFMISMTQCQLCNNCIYKEFPPEADLYFEFKEGSYWIYRNNKTTKVDSLYVTYYERTIGQKKEGCRDDFIRQYLTSSETQKGLLFELYSNPAILVSNAYSSDELNFSNTNIVSISGTSYSKTIIAENCCLSNACKNTKFCNNNGDIVIRKAYFAPNIGLIKWETEKHPIYGKTTFELVRYKIVKP